MLSPKLAHNTSLRTKKPRVKYTIAMVVIRLGESIEY
jgi:hypothetical protein